MLSTCPKCNYVRGANDSHVVEGVCPACGIAYVKWRQQQMHSNSPQQARAFEDLSPTLSQRFLAAIFYVSEKNDSGAVYARAFLLLLFVLWGGWYIFGGIVDGVSWERIGGSFLHNVNLPFHEFGHVLFGFFGRFMAILGGSLFQILLPLIFTIAFVLKRDNFAAAICFWWCGQNFIDVAPYIADAPYRAIPLIGGMGEEYHDWGNLLSMTNALDSAAVLGKLSFAIGTMIMLVSYAWAARIIHLQKRVLQKRALQKRVLQK